LLFKVCDQDNEEGMDQLVGECEVKLAKIMAHSKGEFKDKMFMPQDIEKK